MTSPAASPMTNPAFRTLFAAQICSLLAIGMLTVALSLAAYRIGGNAAAGQLLGLIFALKMVAYVGIAPLAEALLAGRSRKYAMIGLDLLRMSLLVPMAFADSIWLIAALAFGFFALSAAFTPLFQAVIPDILPDEGTYTRALSWSRIAYTLESVLSPVIAAGALRIIAPEQLFLIAAVAFIGSVAALLMTQLPPTESRGREPFWHRSLRGLSIYRRTPRLRGLFLLNLALSFAMAWMLVNSVVYAGLRLGDAERYFPLLMAGYGLGAASGAMAIPALLHRYSERQVMIAGTLVYATLGIVIAAPLSLVGAMMLWAGFGAASSLVLTPGGLVITRSARRRDRAAVFAAQFSLSHLGWLLAYPLSGWLAVLVGLEPALIILSVMCVLTTLFATRIWPADDTLERLHSHPDLPDDHPHMLAFPASHPQHSHRHDYYIDDLHPRWGRNPLA